MAGICQTCVYFRGNVHLGKDKPHHCAALDEPLSLAEAAEECPDHKAK
ncbi:MAG: hypothetical protein ACE5HG_04270 [Candidatus Bathyarchaeia archaeon]